ncbi:MAG: MMPL family transporter [Planctomycetota bacterium]|jgi:predicted RND superfamily exporter protein|nr:MMPL family transporter [Planctomycetota bacterium]
MQKRILRAIAVTACRRHRLILAVALGLTVASWLPPLFSHLWGGLHAPFDLAAMLPRDVPAARDFTRAIVDFESVDEAVVVFRLGGPGEREPGAAELERRPELASEPARLERRRARERHVAAAGRLADALVGRLLADPRISGAFCRKFRQEDKDYLLYEAIPSYGLLMLGDDEIDRVKELMTPEAIRRSVASLKAKLVGVMSGALAMDEWLLMDAIGLGPVFQRAMERYGVAGADGQANGGYLVDREATMLIAVIQPDRPAQSIEFAMGVSADIRAAAAELYDQLIPPAARDSIQVEFGGGYEAAVGYTRHVNSNLAYTLATSLIGVLAIFGLIFRRAGVLLYIGTPLVMVVSWSIGIGWLMYGQLNLISASFAAVLVGLGIDYAIHIYNRYIGERSRGGELEEAFVIAIENTGWGVIIGMVTTAIAFLSLGATRFSQLAEFGVLAGVGIFLSAPVMLFVLPALLVWRYREGGERPASLKPLSLGLDGLGRLIDRRPWPFAVVVAVLLAVSGWRLAFYPGSIRFDERVASLRPPERVFELAGEIARAFSNRNPNMLMLLAYGDDEAAAVEEAARLQDICAKMEKPPPGGGEPLLLAHESFLRYLPPPSVQRRMLKAIREADLPRAAADFRRALDEEGLDEEYFAFTFALLEEHRKRAEADLVVLPSDLAETPLWRYIKRFVSRRRRQIDLRSALPADLRFPIRLAAPAVDRGETARAPAGAEFDRGGLLALYHAPDLAWGERVKRVTVFEPSGWAVKISVYPPPRSAGTGEPLIDDAWLAAVRKRLGVEAGGGRAILAGMPILAHELAEIVINDFRRVSLAVFGICALAILAFFIRHPQRFLWSLSPILIGMVLLAGFMSLTGLTLNFVNTLVIPILIGLGVDNGIHMSERFFESGRDVRVIVSDTGRALVVTALTDFAGFGSLAISGYEGVASMGRLFIVALGLVLAASLLATPALLRIFYRRERA